MCIRREALRDSPGSYYVNVARDAESDALWQRDSLMLTPPLRFQLESISFVLRSV